MNPANSGRTSLRLKFVTAAGAALLFTGCGSPETSQAPGSHPAEGAPRLLESVPVGANGATSWLYSDAQSAELNVAQVAYDAKGNAITFLGTVDGRAPAKLRKISPDGVDGFTKDFYVVYSPEATATPFVRFDAVEADAAGNILVAGLAGGAWNFLGGTPGAGSFIAKLDPQGNRIWGRYTRPAEGTSLVFRDLATKANGDVVALSQFHPGQDEWASIMVTHYNGSTGQPQWERQFGPALPVQQGNAVEVDANNNIHLAGTMGEALNFGSTTLTSSCAFSICTRAFVASLDPAGNHRWSRVIAAGDAENTSDGRVGGLAVQGDAVVASVEGHPTFAGADARRGAHVLAFTRDTGAEQWSRLLREESAAPKLAANAEGQIVALQAGDAVEFGQPDASARYFLTRFTAAGQRVSTWNHMSADPFSVWYFDAAPTGNAIVASGSYETPAANLGMDLYGPGVTRGFEMQVVAP